MLDGQCSQKLLLTSCQSFYWPLCWISFLSLSAICPHYGPSLTSIDAVFPVAEPVSMTDLVNILCLPYLQQKALIFPSTGYMALSNYSLSLNLDFPIWRKQMISVLWGLCAGDMRMCLWSGRHNWQSIKYQCHCSWLSYKQTLRGSSVKERCFVTTMLSHHTCLEPAFQRACMAHTAPG